MKEDKPSDTPFQKAERALWIAVKTLESSVEGLDKSEKQKLTEIKKLLDKLI